MIGVEPQRLVEDHIGTGSLPQPPSKIAQARERLHAGRSLGVRGHAGQNALPALGDYPRPLTAPQHRDDGPWVDHGEHPLAPDPRCDCRGVLGAGCPEQPGEDGVADHGVRKCRRELTEQLHVAAPGPRRRGTVRVELRADRAGPCVARAGQPRDLSLASGPMPRRGLLNTEDAPRHGALGDGEVLARRRESVPGQDVASEEPGAEDLGQLPPRRSAAALPRAPKVAPGIAGHEECAVAELTARVETPEEGGELRVSAGLAERARGIGVEDEKEGAVVGVLELCAEASDPGARLGIGPVAQRREVEACDGPELAGTAPRDPRANEAHGLPGQEAELDGRVGDELLGAATKLRR